uniref:G_PROTEIN_RECEP_F2_4 domain-containing protein n=1 Tax=Strongyloides venezuelensis TaxID=75913 RepID=A0A0K0EZK6_STRVS
MLIPTFICLICFILHSSINFHLYLNNSYSISHKNIPQNSNLPKIIICNNLPFTLAGMTYNNSNKEISLLNHKTILKYLNFLINTSSIRDIPMMLTETEKNSSEYIINELLQFSQKGTKKQNLSTLFYTTCQDIINSCTLNGSIYSSYNCCQRINMNVGTLNGICYTFDSKTLERNGNLRSNKNIGIIFQISRNSFAFNGINNHPGLSIYLVNENDNEYKLQLQDSESYQLTDKRGLKLLLKKNEDVDQLRYSCGLWSTSAKEVDKSWKSPFECLLEAGIRKCGCHPLISEYLVKNTSSLYKLIENSSICFVNQLQDCFYQYLYYSYDQNFYQNQLLDGEVEEKSISDCLRKYPPPCYSSSYSSKRQYYHLTTDYNSTKDFIAELEISYENSITHQNIYSYDYGLFSFLSLIAYNFAFWLLIPIWVMISTYLCSIRADKTYTTIETIERSKVKPTNSIGNINVIRRSKKSIENSIPITDNFNIFEQRQEVPQAINLERSHNNSIH